MEKQVDDVSTFVVKADAIYVLEIDAHDLFLPYFNWEVALARVDFVVYFTLIGEIKIIVKAVTVVGIVGVVRLLDFGRRA